MPKDVAMRLLFSPRLSNSTRKRCRSARERRIIGLPVVAEEDKGYVGHHNNALVHTTALPQDPEQKLTEKYELTPHARLLRVPRRLMARRMQLQALWQKTDKPQLKAALEATAAGIDLALETAEREIDFRSRQSVKVIDPRVIRHERLMAAVRAAQT